MAAGDGVTDTGDEIDAHNVTTPKSASTWAWPRPPPSWSRTAARGALLRQFSDGDLDRTAPFGPAGGHPFRWSSWRRCRPATPWGICPRSEAIAGAGCVNAEDAGCKCGSVAVSPARTSWAGSGTSAAGVSTVTSRTAPVNGPAGRSAARRGTRCRIPVAARRHRAAGPGGGRPTAMPSTGSRRPAAPGGPGPRLSHGVGRRPGVRAGRRGGPAEVERVGRPGEGEADRPSYRYSA